MGSHPLSSHSWYHGCISRDEAEYRLWSTGPVDGCWLVRGSQTLNQRFCLSLWWGGAVSRFFHIIIPVNRSGGFYLDSPAMGFASMADLLFFYSETKRSFTTQSGDTVNLLFACERPGLNGANAQESNYCSTIPVETDSFGLEIAPSTPVLAAKCAAPNIVLTTSTPRSSSLAPPACQFPVGAAPPMAATTFGTKLEKALMQAQVVQCAVDPEDGNAEVEEFAFPSSQQYAKRSMASAARTPQVIAEPPTQLRRRPARRQTGVQRHNAGDNQPILLRKSPEDRKKEKGHHAHGNPVALLRKLGSSLVHVFCVVFLLRSAADASSSKKTDAPTYRHARKSKESRTKASAAGETPPGRLPSRSKVIDITADGPASTRRDDLPQKPILYADDVAGMLRALQEKRMQAQTAAAIPVSVPLSAQTMLAPTTVVTV